MYYTDYHTHSWLSFDSRAPLSSMAVAMNIMGIHEMCLTDHCDLLDERAQRVYDYNWFPALEQYDEVAPRFENRLKIKLGLEFGMGHIDPPCAEKILAQPRLDFVIGSVHNYSPELGGGDLYYANTDTPEACSAILKDYFRSMDLLAKSPYYDILGHIIYPLRYMDENASILDWMEQVDEILKSVIHSDRGIEVNTNRGLTLTEWTPILKRYKELGGEILTVGSDAHEPMHTGLGIPEAYEMLRSLGFKAVCTYDKRKPTFIDI